MRAKEIKSNVVDQNVDSLVFTRSLKDAALAYRDLVQARDTDETLRGLLEQVKMLAATSLYPLLLSAVQVGTDDDMKRLLKAVIATYVRHSAIGGLEITRLEDIVFRLAKDLRVSKDFDQTITEIREFAPNDKQFQADFAAASVKVSTAKYLLRELETKLRITNELTVNTPTHVQVEHIYPQTPQPGNRLPDHESVINRLGNLTLLARRLNASIQNSPFATKQQSYQASDLELTKQLLNYPKWDLDMINDRQRLLAALAVDIWRYDDTATAN